tara:strand:+ start:1075 stop:1992 length:918 start_codon:yes stop_codon:yes gene_type:complete
MSKEHTLVISFSGGRTSGYLTKRLLEQKKKWKDIIVIFANTGQEHEKTLEFINNCDKYFGFNTVWLEAVPHPGEKKGSTAKIVNFKTASRDGKPFERVIEKYGIPWSKAGHCTRELKENPIKNYLKERGLDKSNRVMAIGIRADEAHRQIKTAELNNFIYPLVEWGVDKEDVLDWWEDQDFDLEIPEHMGNCVWCWKKSYKKLATVMKEKPEAFAFPERMEKIHGRTGNIANKVLNNGVLKDQNSIKFFRGFRTVQDIREMAEKGTDFFIDKHYARLSGGCSESCEPFHGDNEDTLNEERKILFI